MSIVPYRAEPKIQKRKFCPWLLQYEAKEACLIEEVEAECITVEEAEAKRIAAKKAKANYIAAKKAKEKYIAFKKKLKANYITA
ncbi:unnamed protein product [Fusarium fujikuroi]|nr:unnamed protein product [Fusarium fujikuroi]